MIGGHGWGRIIGLIIVIAVIWIVVKSMNQNTGSTQSPGKSALDILTERYTKGQIDQKEFEELKDELKKN